MAIVENDPSARMQVRTLGQLMHPAACMVCGNGTCDDGYLDLGVFFDYEGTMYLCMLCVTQAGETVGMFTAEQIQMLQDLSNRTATELETTQQELEDAKRTIDSLNHLLRDTYFATGDAGVSSSEEPESSSVVAEGPTKGSKGRESVTEEPTPFSGPSDSAQSELRHVTFD